jgi:hypothetical protein
VLLFTGATHHLQPNDSVSIGGQREGEGQGNVHDLVEEGDDASLVGGGAGAWLATDGVGHVREVVLWSVEEGEGKKGVSRPNGKEREEREKKMAKGRRRRESKSKITHARIKILPIPTTRETNLPPHPTRAVIRRQIRLPRIPIRTSRRPKAVETNGLGGEGWGVVGAEEGVAGEHSEAVGEGHDFGCVGGVVARDWREGKRRYGVRCREARGERMKVEEGRGTSKAGREEMSQYQRKKRKRRESPRRTVVDQSTTRRINRREAPILPLEVELQESTAPHTEDQLLLFLSKRKGRKV